MNILIDVRLLSRGGASGIEEYTRELLGAMLELDRKNKYQLFYSGLRKAALPEFLSKYPGASAINWNIPNKILDFSFRFLAEPKLERFFGFDVAFSPHFNMLATEKPRVITFHDLSFIHHPYFFSQRQHIWHWLQDYKKQAERASKIIAVSQFTKSDLVELFHIPPEKITTIYSGISGEFLVLSKTNQGLTSFKLMHKLEKPFILYMGTLEPRKNVTALVRAFGLLKEEPQFKDLQLVIAGGMGWLYDEVIREIRNSSFKNDIRLFGKVKTEERVFLYNLAEAFVYPSFFEGFGFPPLEAQACGVPVIASDRTSIPETLGKSALLIDPWRVDVLCGAIKEVVTNRSRRDGLVEAGLTNVRRFSWKESAKMTIETLHESR